MKITAAVSRPGFPTPVLEEVELEDPRSDEIRIRVVATGICHTDVNCHSGHGVPVPKPIVLGHEAAGVVDAVGSGVTNLRPGDHVLLSGGSCGVCAKCRSGLPTYCRLAMPLGFGGARADGSSPLSQGGERIAGSFFAQSSFGTYAVAPARSAVKVDTDLPLEMLGPLACGMITGAGSILEALRVRAGNSLVVFGTGGVGLAAIMAARVAGATRIVAVDVNAERLELARELGATDAVIAGSDLDDALRSLRPNGFEYSFVTADHVTVFDSAVACLTAEGTCGFVVTPRAPWAIDAGHLLAGGRKLQGIIGGSANPHTFIPTLIELWRQGRFPFDRLVETFDFADIADAWEATSSGRVIKPVLIMPTTT